MPYTIEFVGNFWLNPDISIISFRIRGIAYKYHMTPQQAERVQELIDKFQFGRALQKAKGYDPHPTKPRVPDWFKNYEKRARKAPGSTPGQELIPFSRNLGERFPGSALGGSQRTDETNQKIGVANDGRKIRCDKK